MRTMHLFAGAGGGLLADLILGHTPVVAVEWEPYACQVLRERAAEGWFPNLRVWEGDVRLFDPSEYAGSVDCIHAGFPCQDISVAGKQAGVGEETRSGLYREVLRIAGVVRPRYLFLENVSAIVSNGLDTVIADLTKIGYDTEWLCLRASDCGAKHHRDRWWCLANANKNIQLNEHRGCVSGTSKKTKSSKLSSGGSDMADTERIGLQRQRKFVTPINSKAANDWEATESINGCFGSFWSVEPELDRVVNGMARRMDRLKAIGNGQVPLQAAVAWKLLGGP